MENSIEPSYLKTSKFWLLSISSFFFFMSFNMILPELPNYLDHIGGSHISVGWVISSFTIVALLSRPFSGKLTDTIGRIPVMIIGALASCIISLFYGFWVSIFGFFTLRAIHGLSTGFKPTGTAAYVSDIIPDNRRGEAMGILGMMGSLGMAAGPSIGSFIFNMENNYNHLFFCSSMAALVSIVILMRMKETLPLEKRQKFSLSLLKVNRNDFYEKSVLPVGIVFLFTAYCYGTVVVLVPDFSENLGMSNKGLFYTYFLLASLAIRFFAGKISDIYGRERVLTLGLTSLIIAMFVIGFASNKFTFLLGAILFGFSAGINSPTLYAWTTDLSHSENKGRGFATMYIFMELGITIGSLAAGKIYNNIEPQLSMAFYSAGIMAFLGLIYLLNFQFKLKNNQ